MGLPNRESTRNRAHQSAFAGLSQPCDNFKKSDRLRKRKGNKSGNEKYFPVAAKRPYSGALPRMS